MKSFFWFILFLFISSIALPFQISANSSNIGIESQSYLSDFDIDSANNLLFVLYNNPAGVKILDLKEKKLIFEWKLDGVTKVGPLVYHSASRKLYVAGRKNGTLTIIDFSSVKNFTPEELQRVKPTVLEGVSVFPGEMAVDNKNKRLFLLDLVEMKLIVYNSENNNRLTDIPLGPGAGTLDYDEENNVIIVANRQGNSLSIINGANYSSIDAPVGNYPFDVKINPETKKIYVSNHTDNTVSVINETSGELLKLIKTGFRPKRIGINVATNKIYISNYIDDTISVIDGSDDKIIKTILLSQGAFPEEPVIFKKNNRIYIPQSGLHTLAIIDGNNDVLIGEPTPVGLDPLKIIVNDKLNETYVFNFVSENITFINDNSGQIIGGWPKVDSERPQKGEVFSVPIDAVHSGDRTFVLNNYGEFVTIIDGRNNRPISAFKVGKNPQRILTFRDKIYVSNADDDTLTIYNTKNGELKTLKVGDKPRYMMWNNRTDKIYLVNYNDGTISVVDYKKDVVIKTIPVGKKPFYITVNGQINKIYALLSLSENVIVMINGETDEIEKRIALGYNPRFLRVNFANNKIYISGKDKESLTVINGLTGEIISTIKLSGLISEIAIDDQNNRIYAFRPFEKVLSYFPEDRPEEITDVNLGSFLPLANTETYLTLKGSWLYISSLIDRTLLVFDTQSGKVSKTLLVKGSTWSYNPRVNKIYVLNKMDSNVTVFDAKTFNKLAIITNTTPFGAPAPAIEKIYYMVAGLIALGIIIFLIFRRRKKYAAI